MSELLTVGGRLKWLIDRKKITAYKLSQLCQVHQSTLSRILKNESVPKHDTADRIAKVLDSDVEWFLEGSNDPGKLSKNENLGSDYNENVYAVPFISDDKVNNWIKLNNDPNFYSKLDKKVISTNQNLTDELITFRNIGGVVDNIIPNNANIFGIKIDKSKWTDNLYLSKYKYYVLLHADGVIVSTLVLKSDYLVMASKNEMNIEVHPDKCVALYGIFKYDFDF